MNENYAGQIAINDEIDNYMFTLDNSGGFDLLYTAENIEAVNLKIYDDRGQEIWSQNPWWNSTSKQISFTKHVELTSGTYYFSVSKYSGYGTYEFNLATEETQNDEENDDDYYDYDNSLSENDDYYDDNDTLEENDDYYNNDDGMQENTIKVRTSDLSIYINGSKVYFPDARPFLDSADRTQVPVRFISEALGYDVGWRESIERVSIFSPTLLITIYIGDDYITVRNYDSDYGDYNYDSEEFIQMDTTAITKDDRTYVPLRYIAEALGYTVEWE